MQIKLLVVALLINYLMSKFTIMRKECPNCGKEQVYTNKVSYRRAIVNNQLCKSCAFIKKDKKQGDCSQLLKEDILTYYWLGFIFADGHIEKSKRLQVSLGIKDIGHLKKLQKFLLIENLRDCGTYCSMSIMDVFNIKQLVEKFSIASNKTKSPCNLSNIKGDLLTALFIGFIDGDGSVAQQTGRKDHCIYIKCHPAWLGNLNIFSNHVSGENKAYIDKQGWAKLHIANNKTIKELKKFINTHYLPVLTRKWDKILINA